MKASVYAQSDIRATSKEGLKRIALKVWEKITPDYLASLYDSMPHRMQAVVDAQGGHTKYQAFFNMFMYFSSQ